MLLCMRTTIEIEDRLFRDLKRQAADKGVTLRQLVNDLLRQGLNGPKPRGKYKFNWKVQPLGTIQPGVDLNDRKSLFDLLDGR